MMKKISQERFDTLFEGGERNFSNCQFEGIEMKDRDLSGCNFSNSLYKNCKLLGLWGKRVNFSDTEFEASYLAECRFEDSKFSHMKFQGSNIDNCEFRDCNLKNVHFERTALLGSNFDNCDISDFYGLDIKLSETSFELRNANRVDFWKTVKNVNLVNVDFNNCGIHKYRFQKCNFQNVSFDGAELDCVFTQGKMNDVEFNRSVMCKTSTFYECDLKNITVLDSDWQQVCICDVKASNCMFKNSNLKRIDMKGDFSEVNFVNVEFHDYDENGIFNSCVWKHSNLKDSNFTNCDLRYADFRESTLTAIKLAESKMNGSRFDYASLNRVVFDDCCCKDASFVQCDITDSMFKQTTLDENALTYSEVNHVLVNLQQDINQNDSKIAETVFQRDPSVKRLPESLVEKLKTMEKMTGKRISVIKAGKVTLPPGELARFSEREVVTLNSYYMNQAAEKTMQTVRMVPER